MDYDSFIGAVQNRAHLPTREDAVRVTRISLETLSERVEPGGARNLSAQLPEEIGRHLEKIDSVESFTYGEFIDRLVEKGAYNTERDRADAVHHARVVIDVLGEAVNEGMLDDIRAQFPEDDDWDGLFVLAEQDEKPVNEEQRAE